MKDQFAAPTAYASQQLFNGFLQTFGGLPTTNWQRAFNPQFFIAGNPDDVCIENHVLHEVASYGKQLSVIIDCVAVLAARLPLEKLRPEERQILEQFVQLKDQVHAATTSYYHKQRTERTKSAIAHTVADLQALKHSDPNRYKALVELLHAELPLEEPSSEE